jgi:CheY-like chemotaxis protein
VVLPGIDGFETCRRLKANEATKDIPVIFITSLTNKTDNLKGFEVGGADYITKPHHFGEMFARVNTHLKIRKLQQQLQKEIAEKDQFFSIISHDLRGPLSSVRDLTRFVVEHNKGSRQDELENMLGLLQDSADNLYSLVENLLTWSQLQRGRIDYNPQPSDTGIGISEKHLSKL